VVPQLLVTAGEPPRLLGLLLRLRPVSARIDVPLSLPGKRIIAYGAEEAERLHHRRINLEHILMGVVREGDGAAGQVRSAGLNVINMREQMLLNATATE